MSNLAHQLWNDEAGYIISAEMVLIATIVVLSLVAGLAEVAYAVNSELVDLAQGFSNINQNDDGDNYQPGSLYASGHEHEQ